MEAHIFLQFFVGFPLAHNTIVTTNIPWSFAYAPLGQKSKQISSSEFLRFLMNTLYEIVNNGSWNWIKIFARLLAPTIGPGESYEEYKLTNSGLTIQFYFPTMRKKIGEMWHYLKMQVSITD